MSDAALLIERPSLRSLTATVSFFALNAAGIVIFLPSGYFLARSDGAQLSDWLLWLIPLGMWASGYLPGFQHVRAYVQIAAGLLLVLMTLVAPQGPSWIPVGVVTFAVIVAAVFNLSARSALGVVLLSAAIDFITVQSNSTSLGLFGVGLVAPWAGALLNLIAGGGILAAWTAWMRNVKLADSEFEQIQAASAREEQALAAQTGTEAVRRRIHETILNTLAGISMGLPPDAQSRAEMTCQRDLEQLNRGLDALPDAPLSAIIQAAQQAIEPTALVCTVEIPRDVTVTAGVANALRDAIAESLRNVERHSGVLHATISTTITDDITVVIADEGRGPSPSDQERFGVRNAVRANLGAIGGSATLSRGVSRGTVVTLHAPIVETATLRTPTFPTLGIADSTIWGRLGVTGTNLYLLILTPTLITEFSARGLTATAISAYVVCMLALALLWRTAIKPALIALGVALVPLPFLTAGSGSLTCVAAPGIQGLITGMAGGGVMLLLIAAPRIWIRVSIGGLAFSLALWLALRLPATCEQEALLSVGVNAIYMAAIIVVLTWIDIRFDTRRANAQREWEQALNERIQRERRTAEEAGWMAVPATTRRLLEQLASGTIKVSNPETQARAAHEAELVRSRLGLGGAHAYPLDHFVSALTPAAQSVGSTIEVNALITGRREDPLPAQAIEFVDQLIRSNSPESFSVRTIVDDDWEDFVVVMPATHEPHQVPECFADVLVEIGYEDELLHLSLRRPV